MRWIAVALLLAACGQSSEEKALARRVYDLETQVSALTEKAAAKKYSLLDAKRDMSLCVSGADDAYWRVIELNGRKKRGTENQPGGPVWTARNDIWELAATKKRLALEECRMQYASKD